MHSSPPQSLLTGTERLPGRMEALIQGWEVWYSSPPFSTCLSLVPSFLSISAVFVMPGLYRSWNSSLPSDPISDLNILAVPPCKRKDEKSCPFTNALHPSISPYPSLLPLHSPHHSPFVTRASSEIRTRQNETKWAALPLRQKPS